MQIIEVWKDIPNYEGLYQASNLGNIKSMQRFVRHSCGGQQIVNERILKATKKKTGYLVVDLSKDGMRDNFRVHRLILLSFQRCSNLPIDHIDGRKDNNNLSNLEYVTARENTFRHFDGNKKTSSKYVGVTWASDRNKWRSSIRINNKLKRLGSFDSETDAAKAYQDARATLCK